VKSADMAYQITNDNMQWLEHTFRKVGSWLSLKADGYSLKDVDPNKLANNAGKAESMAEAKAEGEELV
jgi:hypothetical protein